jgi:hypothetical protein
VIWVKREAKYFCKGDWTGNQQIGLICPSGNHVARLTLPRPPHPARHP